MEKTKFTFVSPSRLVGAFAFALLTFVGLPQAFAQCPTPENVTVSYNCDGEVVLDWDITDPNGLVETYTVDIENGNQPVVDFVNMEETILTIVPGTLEPGTTYNYAITANCAQSNVSSAIGQIEGEDIQNSQPEIVLVESVNPVCPDDEPTGSITVTVEDDDCDATYDLAIDGSTEFFDVEAGEEVTFEDLTAGAKPDGTTYTISISGYDAGDCNYDTDEAPCVTSVDLDVTLEASDNTEPLIDVTANAGVAVGSGSEFSFTPPEGECGYQWVWSVFVFDNCDAPGDIDFDVDIVNENAGVDPSVSWEVFDIDAAYSVNIFAAVGTNEITITATDENGNTAIHTSTIIVEDERDPVIYGPGDMNVQIPACQDQGIPVNWTVSADDDCDLDVALELDEANTSQEVIDGLADAGSTGSGVILTVGTYDVAYTATDDAGNDTDYSFTITVDQADSPAPIIDVSGNSETYTAAACEQDVFAVFSANIYDCDLDASTFDPLAIQASVAPLTPGAIPNPGFFFTNPQDGFVYFELAGVYTPGAYQIFISYGGVDVDFIFEVVQETNQAPDIEMPGNLSFLEPICAPGADLSFQVQITDDCDIDLSGATFTLNGGAAPAIDAGASDPASGLYVWNLDDIPAGTYTLVASYTDGAGITSTGTSTFTVTDQPDTAVPIIVYPSQNINITLDPCGPSTTETTFQISAFDNCSLVFDPDTDVTVDNGGTITFFGGSEFTLTAAASANPYTVTIIARDAAGNQTVENFNVTVSQADPPQENLACNDDLNVTLDANCSRVITADMVLDGNFGCLEESEFTINIVNDAIPTNGNILDGYGQWVYEISHPDASTLAGFENCWGYITGEDKAAPTLVCPPNTSTATVEYDAHVVPGTVGSAQINLNDYSCFLDAAFDNPLVDDQNNGTTPSAGPHNYSLVTFQVDQEDVYTLFLDAPGFDAFTAIFQGSFNPQDPCGTILYAADENAFGSNDMSPIGGVDDPQARLTLPLRPGIDYVVMVAAADGSAGGSFEHTIISDGNGRIIVGGTTLPTTPESFVVDLMCTDFDNIYGGDLNGVAAQTAFIQGTYPWVGTPIADDNCDGATPITATDVFTEAGDCGPVVITRTFNSVDVSGNEAVPCTQEITFRKPTFADVILPSYTAVVECDEDYPALANGNPSPELTGYPFIFTATNGIVDLNESFCNIGATYEDLARIDECEGTFKFRREWTFYDWCAPGTSFVYNQLIKVGDYTAPTVSCPAGELVYSTSPFSCNASFAVPMPVASDNCSDVTVSTEIVTEVSDTTYTHWGAIDQITTELVLVRSIAPGASRFVSGIPLGSHFFRYIVEDDCGNETEVLCPFEVIDEIEPVAVCDDQLNVSVSGNNIFQDPDGQAIARVFAEDVDEGSWDNCGVQSILVKRDGVNATNNGCGSFETAFGPSVDFFCCDVNQTVKVTLQVTDLSGNTNICWLNVVPEDKLNPVCEAPADIVMDCDELPHGFDFADVAGMTDAELNAMFGGDATGADNCPGFTIDQTASGTETDCGAGTITRTFTVTDASGNTSAPFSCVQTIQINLVHNYEIKFPEDDEFFCGSGVEPDSVIYNEIGCDLLAVTSSDEQFSASGDECYKIFRTWKVINWCQYGGEGDPIIVGRDEDCDGAPGDDCVWVLRRPNGIIYYDNDNDETASNNSVIPNPCGPSNDFHSSESESIYQGVNDNTPPIGTPGYYQYTQIIKVYDDVAPEISFTAPEPFCTFESPEEGCDADVVYPFAVLEDCTPEDLTFKVFLNPFLSGNLQELPASVITGTYPNFTITVTDLPIGDHAFVVSVEDGCGNSSAQSVLPFSIIDCKPPAPICLSGITIELMPVDADGDGIPDPGLGMAEIWATDFVDFSVQAPDCSEPIKYSINLVEGGEYDPNVDWLEFDCETLAEFGEFVPVQIWGTDSSGDGVGDADFCQTFIILQDNMGVCGEAAPMAAGAVNTESDEPVEDVEVSLSGQTSAAMTTQNDGAYVFTNLTEGLDYTITPQRDGDYLNGVSTFDLVLISRHILGVNPLSTPYQRIAADVNNSGSITTLDLIQLRKLILSIDTEFANNTSWRFVEEAYVFPDPSNPWAEQFPEVININDLPESSIMNANFVAVKIGDVNGDAAANSFAGIEGRSYEGTFALETAEQELKAGNEYRVSFTAAELARIEGYQATLTLNNSVELVDIISGVATEENFGLTYLGEGMITTSWNGEASDAELFTLVLRANSDVMLSEVLGVSSAVTKAEAYGKDGSFQDVAIEFSNGTVAGAGFELYQNQPNPFKGETVIGFNLPEAAQATITISDITGKVLKLYRLDGSKGYNQITVKSTDLAATGVVSYTVETDDYTATKKMVIIK